MSGSRTDSATALSSSRSGTVFKCMVSDMNPLNDLLDRYRVRLRVALPLRGTTGGSSPEHRHPPLMASTLEFRFEKRF